MSILRRISNLFSRPKLQQEIDAELRSHIDMRIEDNIAAGMSPGEARRDALQRFGNPTSINERVWRTLPSTFVMDCANCAARPALR
jgi:hypothetical protein